MQFTKISEEAADLRKKIAAADKMINQAKIAEKQVLTLEEKL